MKMHSRQRVKLELVEKRVVIIFMFMPKRLQFNGISLADRHTYGISSSSLALVRTTYANFEFPFPLSPWLRSSYPLTTETEFWSKFQIGRAKFPPLIFPHFREYKSSSVATLVKFSSLENCMHSIDLLLKVK